MEKISVIVINYNTPDMTRTALETLVRNKGVFDLEIIVIENGSEKKMAPDTRFREIVSLYLENQENIGFAQAVNQGIKRSTGAYILLLNSDAFLDEGSLAAMAAFLKENEAYSIVGPKTVNRDGTFQVSAGRFPNLLGEMLSATRLYRYMRHPMFLGERSLLKGISSLSVDWVSGGCMLIKREAVAAVGIFDGRYFFGVEDMDFCYRVKAAGYLVGYLPHAAITHWHGYSSGGTRSRFKLEHEARGKALFFQKHFPRQKVSRYVVLWLYHMRIALLGLFGKLK